MKKWLSIFFSRKSFVEETNSHIQSRKDMKGGIVLTKEQVERLENALLLFVERVAQNGATAAEVEALPAVARVLMEYGKTM